MNKIDEQEDRVAAEIRKLEEMGGSITGVAEEFRDSAFEKFPIIFVFLSTFGLVATFYGFEKVIDQISYFEENPHMVLVAGIITLGLTGTLFKKLY